MTYKKAFLLNFFIFFFLDISAQLCEGAKVILLDTLVDDGREWRLEFEDNFDGNSIDLSKWTVNECALSPDNAYRLQQNVIVSSDYYKGKNSTAFGVCKIILKNETITKPAQPWIPGSPINTYFHTTGDIWSKEEFGWGKYEIRCKVPKGNNFWSAFCMYAQRNGIGNEIDIFEFSNNTNLSGDIIQEKQCRIVEMHYHRWDKTMSLDGIDHNCGNSVGDANTPDYSEDFHTFTIIWDRWGISWYIDNRFIKMVGQWYDLNGFPITKQNVKPFQVAIRNEWYPTLNMSLGIGLNLKGKPTDIKTDDFPGYYLIDYVRYYKLY
jgi:beta-glucanase (GH16 family)